MKEILQVQRQLKKDEIVDKASRMIKDHDSPIVKGMTEIANRWIQELDKLFFELKEIENKLADINNKPQS